MLTVKENEEIYRALFDSLECVFVHDLNGRFLDANGALLELLGYRREEILGLDFSSLLDSEQGAAARRSPAELLDAGTPQPRTEFRLRCRNGDFVDVEAGLSLVYRDGKPYAVLGIANDITKLREAEKALVRHNDLLLRLNRFSIDLSLLPSEESIETLVVRQLLDLTGGVGAIFTEYDPATRMTTVKHVEVDSGLLERVIRVLGRQLIGFQAPLSEELYQTITTLGGRVSRTLHEASFRSLPRPVAAAIQVLLNADRFIGVVYLVERSLYGTSLVAMGKGTPDPPEAVLKNFSSRVALALRRRQADARLRESEERHRLLADNASDVIWTMDIEGNLTYVSPSVERLRGFTAAELTGRSFISSLTPESAVAAQEAFMRAVAGIQAGRAATEFQGELEQPCRDGSTVWTDQRVTEIRDASGRWAGFLGVSRDITERKQAESRQRELERQLQERQRLESLGVLAGGIAHDFNNMLTAILGYSDMILDGGVGVPDDVLSDVGEIKQAAERGKALTGAILAFSRRQPREVQIFSLSSLVAELEPLLRRTLGEHIELVCNLTAKVRLVEADPGQVGQVLMNLVVNARDAMPAGGTLTIEVAAKQLNEQDVDVSFALNPGDWALLTVSDTGVGMDPAIVPRVFEPFFTTKGPGEGTGLGLSTAYGIVKQSGGEIVVRSEPGLGTTFEVYLPCVGAGTESREGFATGRAEAPKAPSVPPDGSGRTVLLVEDEPAVRRLATRLLREQGHTVLVASDGLEALDVARDHSVRIDLLLTDVVLPGPLQGDAVARSVLEERPGLKVVFMSGYPRDSLPRSGRLEEGMTYLDKPFTADDLAVKLREALGQDH